MKKNGSECMNLPIVEEVKDNEVKESVFKFSDDFVKEVHTHAKKIINEIGKAEKAFVNVACEMAWLYKNDRFQAIEMGVSFEQFALNHFGFKKTQAYALVNLVDRFGFENEKGLFEIKEDFQKFGQTKLINMVNLTDKQIADNITPDMTVSQIQKKVKELTKIDSLGVDSGTSTTAPMESEEESEVVEVPARCSNFESVASYATFKDFEDNLMEVLKGVDSALKNKVNARVTVNVEW